jgi:hypothetical protein
MRLHPQIAVFSLIYCKIELQSIVIDPFRDIEVFTPLATEVFHVSVIMNSVYIRFKLVADYVGPMTVAARSKA